jgi:hypothetical protein
MEFPEMKKLSLAVIGLLCSIAVAFAQTPALPLIPLGYCQLSATQLGSAVALSKCVRATFTASSGSNPSQLVVSAITNGVIKIGDQIVSGTGLTVGTIITGFVPGSGTNGGAGTYTLSATNTASSATVTSGGIPTGANEALIESDTAAVRWRDDGGVPTALIGYPIAANAPPWLYTGTLSAMQLIAQTGSPVVNISFYKSP